MHKKTAGRRGMMQDAGMYLIFMLIITNAFLILEHLKNKEKSKRIDELTEENNYYRMEVSRQKDIIMIISRKNEPKRTKT
jgi:hypothetical protein